MPLLWSWVDSKNISFRHYKIYFILHSSVGSATKPSLIPSFKIFTKLFVMYTYTRQKWNKKVISTFEMQNYTFYILEFIKYGILYGVKNKNSLLFIAQEMVVYNIWQHLFMLKVILLKVQGENEKETLKFLYSLSDKMCPRWSTAAEIAWTQSGVLPGGGFIKLNTHLTPSR